MMLWPIFVWIITIPLIGAYAYGMYVIAVGWNVKALAWFDKYIPRDLDLLIQEFAEKAERLGVWVDHRLAAFWLHYISEIDTDKKGEPKQSEVFWIIVLTAMLSFSPWVFLTMVAITTGNTPLAILGLLFWVMVWCAGLSLLPISWWLRDWSRQYSGAIIMSEGPSYAIKTVFSLMDLMTGGDPKFSVYPVKPEKVTQTPSSSDPEELARTASIQTNELSERFINWFLTPKRITAVRMLALAAEYGRPMFIQNARAFWKSIDAAGNANVLNTIFDDTASKQGAAEFLERRKEGRSIAEALTPLGLNLDLVGEYKGPKVELHVLDVMKPGFSMPAPAQVQYRGNTTP